MEDVVTCPHCGAPLIPDWPGAWRAVYPPIHRDHGRVLVVPWAADWLRQWYPTDEGHMWDLLNSLSPERMERLGRIVTAAVRRRA